MDYCKSCSKLNGSRCFLRNTEYVSGESAPRAPRSLFPTLSSFSTEKSSAACSSSSCTASLADSGSDFVCFASSPCTRDTLESSFDTTVTENNNKMYLDETAAASPNASEVKRACDEQGLVSLLYSSRWRRLKQAVKAHREKEELYLTAMRPFIQFQDNHLSRKDSSCPQLCTLNGTAGNASFSAVPNAIQRPFFDIINLWAFLGSVRQHVACLDSPPSEVTLCVREWEWTAHVSNRFVVSSKTENIKNSASLLLPAPSIPFYPLSNINILAVLEDFFQLPSSHSAHSPSEMSILSKRNSLLGACEDVCCCSRSFEGQGGVWDLRIEHTVSAENMPLDANGVASPVKSLSSNMFSLFSVGMYASCSQLAASVSALTTFVARRCMIQHCAKQAAVVRMQKRLFRITRAIVRAATQKQRTAGQEKNTGKVEATILSDSFLSFLLCQIKDREAFILSRFEDLRGPESGCTFFSVKSDNDPNNKNKNLLDPASAVRVPALTVPWGGHKHKDCCSAILDGINSLVYDVLLRSLDKGFRDDAKDASCNLTLPPLLVEPPNFANFVRATHSPNRLLNCINVCNTDSETAQRLLSELRSFTALWASLSQPARLLGDTVGTARSTPLSVDNFTIVDEPLPGKKSSAKTLSWTELFRGLDKGSKDVLARMQLLPTLAGALWNSQAGRPRTATELRAELQKNVLSSSPCGAGDIALNDLKRERSDAPPTRKPLHGCGPAGVLFSDLPTSTSHYIATSILQSRALSDTIKRLNQRLKYITESTAAVAAAKEKINDQASAPTGKSLFTGIDSSHGSPEKMRPMTAPFHAATQHSETSRAGNDNKIASSEYNNNNNENRFSQQDFFTIPNFSLSMLGSSVAGNTLEGQATVLYHIILLLATGSLKDVDESNFFDLELPQEYMTFLSHLANQARSTRDSVDQRYIFSSESAKEKATSTTGKNNQLCDSARPSAVIAVHLSHVQQLIRHALAVSEIVNQNPKIEFRFSNDIINTSVNNQAINNLRSCVSPAERKLSSVESEPKNVFIRSPQTNIRSVFKANLVHYEPELYESLLDGEKGGILSLIKQNENERVISCSHLFPPPDRKIQNGVIKAEIKQKGSIGATDMSLTNASLLAQRNKLIKSRVNERANGERLYKCTNTSGIKKRCCMIEPPSKKKANNELLHLFKRGLFFGFSKNIKLINSCVIKLKHLINTPKILQKKGVLRLFFSILFLLLVYFPLYFYYCSVAIVFINAFLAFFSIFETFPTPLLNNSAEKCEANQIIFCSKDATTRLDVALSSAIQRWEETISEFVGKPQATKHEAGESPEALQMHKTSLKPCQRRCSSTSLVLRELAFEVQIATLQLLCMGDSILLCSCASWVFICRPTEGFEPLITGTGANKWYFASLLFAATHNLAGWNTNAITTKAVQDVLQRHPFFFSASENSSLIEDLDVFSLAPPVLFALHSLGVRLNVGSEDFFFSDSTEFLKVILGIFFTTIQGRYRHYSEVLSGHGHHESCSHCDESQIPTLASAASFSSSFAHNFIRDRHEKFRSSCSVYSRNAPHYFPSKRQWLFALRILRDAPRLYDIAEVASNSAFDAIPSKLASRVDVSVAADLTGWTEIFSDHPPLISLDFADPPNNNSSCSPDHTRCFAEGTDSNDKEVLGTHPPSAPCPDRVNSGPWSLGADNFSTTTNMLNVNATHGSEVPPAALWVRTSTLQEHLICIGIDYPLTNSNGNKLCQDNSNDLTVSFWSRSIANATGFSSAEILGRPLRLLLVDERASRNCGTAWGGVDCGTLMFSWSIQTISFLVANLYKHFEKCGGNFEIDIDGDSTPTTDCFTGQISLLSRLHGHFIIRCTLLMAMMRSGSSGVVKPTPVIIGTVVDEISIHPTAFVYRHLYRLLIFSMVRFINDVVKKVARGSAEHATEAILRHILEFNKETSGAGSGLAEILSKREKKRELPIESGENSEEEKDFCLPSDKLAKFRTKLLPESLLKDIFNAFNIVLLESSNLAISRSLYDITLSPQYNSTKLSVSGSEKIDAAAATLVRILLSGESLSASSSLGPMSNDSLILNKDLKEDHSTFFNIFRLPSTAPYIPPPPQNVHNAAFALLDDILTTMSWPQFLLRVNRSRRVLTSLVQREDLLEPLRDFCQSTMLDYDRRFEVKITFDDSVSKYFVCDAATVRASLVALGRAIWEHQVMVNEAEKFGEASRKPLEVLIKQEHVIEMTLQSELSELLCAQQGSQVSPADSCRSQSSKASSWRTTDISRTRMTTGGLTGATLYKPPPPLYPIIKTESISSNGGGGGPLLDPVSKSRFFLSDVCEKSQGNYSQNAPKDQHCGTADELSTRSFDLVALSVTFTLPEGNTFVWEDYYNAHKHPEKFITQLRYDRNLTAEAHGGVSAALDDVLMSSSENDTVRRYNTVFETITTDIVIAQDDTIVNRRNLSRLAEVLRRRQGGEGAGGVADDCSGATSLDPSTRYRALFFIAQFSKTPLVGLQLLFQATMVATAVPVETGSSSKVPHVGGGSALANGRTGVRKGWGGGDSSRPLESATMRLIIPISLNPLEPSRNPNLPFVRSHQTSPCGQEGLAASCNDDALITVIAVLQPNTVLSSYYSHYLGTVRKHTVVICNSICDLIAASRARRTEIAIISEQCCINNSCVSWGHAEVEEYLSSFFSQKNGVFDLQPLGIDVEHMLAPREFFLALSNHFNLTLVWAVDISRHQEVGRTPPFQLGGSPWGAESVSRMNPMLNGPAGMVPSSVTSLSDLVPLECFSAPQVVVMHEGENPRGDGTWVVEETLSSCVASAFCFDGDEEGEEGRERPFPGCWPQILAAVAQRRHSDEVFQQRNEHFYITGLVGKGTSGKVYRAIERVTRGIVAIKVILGGKGTRGQNILIPNILEVDAMSQLRHRNVVRHFCVLRGDQLKAEFAGSGRRDSSEDRAYFELSFSARDKDFSMWAAEEDGRGHPFALPPPLGGLASPRFRRPLLRKNDLCVVMEYCDSSAERLISEARTARLTFQNPGLISPNPTNDPLPLPRVLVLFRQLICAIVFLHKKFIYHRDIKPGNCLVMTEEVLNSPEKDEEDETNWEDLHRQPNYRVCTEGIQLVDIVKLSDFGCSYFDSEASLASTQGGAAAVAVAGCGGGGAHSGPYRTPSDGSPLASTLTPVGSLATTPREPRRQLVGTLWYIAPETLCGPESLERDSTSANSDPLAQSRSTDNADKADVWSAGMFLTELLFILPQPVRHCSDLPDLLNLYERYRTRARPPDTSSPKSSVAIGCPFFSHFNTLVPQIVKLHLDVGCSSVPGLVSAITGVYASLRTVGGGASSPPPTPEELVTEVVRSVGSDLLSLLLLTLADAPQTRASAETIFAHPLWKNPYIKAWQDLYYEQRFASPSVARGGGSSGSWSAGSCAISGSRVLGAAGNAEEGIQKPWKLDLGVKPLVKEPLLTVTPETPSFFASMDYGALWGDVFSNSSSEWTANSSEKEDGKPSSQENNDEHEKQ